MTDVFTIVILAIMLGVIMIGLGISLISQSLNPLGYNENWRGQNSREYYRNPLWTNESKYFHYKPKGSVIISKEKWAEIEASIGIKIADAQKKGDQIGYNKALIDLQDLIKENQAKVTPKDPYAILGIESKASSDEVTARFQALVKTYDPRNFVDLDTSFVQLAEIRTEQIKKAYKKIMLGYRGLNSGQF